MASSLKINKERLEALLHEMLSEVARGPYEEVSMCIRDDGIHQVQIKVTADREDFIGAVTTGVVES